MIESHENQEAYSQTGTGCPLSDLWRGAGREMRTQYGTAPNRPASGSTIACSGLNAARLRNIGPSNVGGNQQSRLKSLA